MNYQSIKQQFEKDKQYNHVTSTIAGAQYRVVCDSERNFTRPYTVMQLTPGGFWQQVSPWYVYRRGAERALVRQWFEVNPSLYAIVHTSDKRFIPAYDSQTLAGIRSNPVEPITEIWFASGQREILPGAKSERSGRESL